MSETVLTIDEAARTLPDLVERVRTNGGSALLTRAGEPLARIVPVAGQKSTDDLITFLHRWRTDHPDPDDQFAAAVAESRGGVRPPHDPWE